MNLAARIAKAPLATEFFDADLRRFRRRLAQIFLVLICGHLCQISGNLRQRFRPMNLAAWIAKAPLATEIFDADLRRFRRRLAQIFFGFNLRTSARNQR